MGAEDRGAGCRVGDDRVDVGGQGGRVVVARGGGLCGAGGEAEGGDSGNGHRRANAEVHEGSLDQGEGVAPKRRRPGEPDKSGAPLTCD